ncbi:MAG: hypothetical protein ABJF28_18535 [Nisaea sp.]|uniref:hypothetical protein n=1 Tax=Nisaea sp. TaxID=2024842 RepID=UPI003267C4A9
MSLCMMAARLMAVRALQGRTLVDENVLDSEIGALSLDERGQLAVSKSSRFIAVYTDEADASPGQDGNRRFLENGKVVFRFEIGITSAMVIEEDDPDHPGRKMQSAVSGIPFTDGSSEIYLDLVDRQVMSALMDPANEAADIFRGLSGSLLKIDRQRAAGNDSHQRIAARQIALTFELLSDPASEEQIQPKTPFGRFLAMLEAGSSDDQRLAGLIRAEVHPGTNDWTSTQERLGLARSELSALGIGPIIEGAGEMSADTFAIAVEGHGLEVVD